MRDLSAYAHEDPAVVGPWLTEGAAELAEGGGRRAGPADRLAAGHLPAAPRPEPGIEVIGDEKLLDFWLDRVSFG
jgi:hypothetical protein